MKILKNYKENGEVPRDGKRGRFKDGGPDEEFGAGPDIMQPAPGPKQEMSEEDKKIYNDLVYKHAKKKREETRRLQEEEPGDEEDNEDPMENIGSCQVRFYRANEEYTPG